MISGWTIRGCEQLPILRCWGVIYAQPHGWLSQLARGSEPFEHMLQPVAYIWNISNCIWITNGNYTHTHIPPWMRKSFEKGDGWAGFPPTLSIHSPTSKNCFWLTFPTLKRLVNVPLRGWIPLFFLSTPNHYRKFPYFGDTYCLL